jgi:DNA modification methylase
MRLAEAIVKRRVDQLVPYASNSRTHSAKQIAQIAASIKEFGFTNPVLVDGEGAIVAGHARVLAAKELGLKQVPTIDIGYLSETQRQAYVIADNKLAENAGWDQEMLRLELGDLRDAGFDLRLAGFSELELVSFWAERGLTDPDEAPEPPATPVTLPGDVWLLGRHRLVCGDSTDADTVAKALNGVAPHLMVTDPPYGVEYDAAWRNRAAAQGKIGQKKASRAIGTVLNDDRADWRETWALFPGDVAYVWHAGTKAGLVLESLEALDLIVRTQIIWAKNNFAIGRGHYHVQHEPCWYVVRKGKRGHWAADRKQTTLWAIGKPTKSETGHSTQKPVECMRRPIENNSSPGQAVYDPFLGSGTTIIAAEMTGRACHAIELSPAYVDVAVLRWQAFTGAEATLEGDGRSFAAVAEQRGK